MKERKKQRLTCRSKAYYISAGQKYSYLQEIVIICDFCTSCHTNTYNTRTHIKHIHMQGVSKNTRIGFHSFGLDSPASKHLSDFSYMQYRDGLSTRDIQYQNEQNLN